MASFKRRAHLGWRKLNWTRRSWQKKKGTAKQRFWKNWIAFLQPNLDFASESSFLRREFQDKMRVFTQFNSAKEHEKFFENLQSKLLLRWFCLSIGENVWKNEWTCLSVNDCRDVVPLIHIVAEEKQIKVRIKELMKYRRNGITKLDSKLQIGLCSICVSQRKGSE